MLINDINISGDYVSLTLDFDELIELVSKVPAEALNSDVFGVFELIELGVFLSALKKKKEINYEKKRLHYL